MLATIEVQDSKCPDPLACRRCLLTCPTRVLGLGTNVAPQKFRETEAAHFIVRGVRLNYCNGCMECVRICPNRALRVSLS